MKTVGTLVVALVTMAAISTPAEAGKRKGKAARSARAQAVEAPRRLSDQLGFVLVAAPADPQAVAAEPAAPAIDDATAAELGERALERAAAFELSPDRTAASPTGDAAPVVVLRHLTDTEIGATIGAHVEQLAYCWNRVPAARRDALQVGLSFTIQPEGAVSALAVTGEAPAKFAACVTTVAKRWTFPHADTTTEVDYPLSFATLR